MIKIGVLNLQGDVSEHFKAMKKAVENINKNIDILKAKSSDEVSKCDGIVISGGESTVIGKLMKETGIKNVIVYEDIPVWEHVLDWFFLEKKLIMNSLYLN